MDVVTYLNLWVNGGLKPDPDTIDFPGDINVFGDMTVQSNADFQGDVYVAEYIYHQGDLDTYIRFQNDQIDINATTINLTGSITATGDLYVPEYIYHDGDLDTYMRFQTNQWNLNAGGTDAIEVNSNDTIIKTNEFYVTIISLLLTTKITDWLMQNLLTTM